MIGARPPRQRGVLPNLRSKWDQLDKSSLVVGDRRKRRCVHTSDRNALRCNGGRYRASNSGWEPRRASPSAATPGNTLDGGDAVGPQSQGISQSQGVSTPGIQRPRNGGGKRGEPRAWSLPRQEREASPGLCGRCGRRTLPALSASLVCGRAGPALALARGAGRWPGCWPLVCWPVVLAWPGLAWRWSVRSLPGRVTAVVSLAGYPGAPWPSAAVLAMPWQVCERSPGHPWGDVPLRPAAAHRLS